MGTSRVIFLNGASGSGKTSTAELLSQKIKKAKWVYPDSLWNTPTMQSEEILTAAVEHILKEKSCPIYIVDCQILPNAIQNIPRINEIEDWVSVLHHCSDDEREKRLIARGWGNNYFDRISQWASLLLLDAQSRNDLIVDSVELSTEEVCVSILAKLKTREKFEEFLI